MAECSGIDTGNDLWMEKSISGQRGVQVRPYAVYQVMRTSLAVELLRCPCLWHCLGKPLYLLRSAERYISLACQLGTRSREGLRDRTILFAR
jgi:hypothetical protein